jgi:microsomal prostaglandin-E synthase 2
MTQSKLYQYEVCPFCWKVRVGLALKKASFEKIEVHPLNKKELSFTDYKKVPVYIDSTGQQVNDSNKILAHIDNEFAGGPKLFREEVSSEQQKWLDWAENYVKAIPPLIYDTFPNALKAFDYITKLSNFSWFQKKTIKYSGALVMKMVGKKYREKFNIPNPPAKVKDYISEWNAARAGKPFRGGEAPDVTDVAVYGVTLSTRELPHSKLFTGDVEFKAWMDRMGEQSGIRF